ncbi:MAG: preprotein translocase subunit SecY [Deltaproteobacteria bacterium]|nr:preprotein translocase subunit SecY [Deltaproteobacteria bacterium]
MRVAAGLVNMFRIPELRKRIIYTLALLAVYRVGIFVSTPGVDRGIMSDYLKTQSGGGGFLGLFNFFSGGALEQLSVFALGIMPYVTSSIIMQLMTVVVPSLERLQKEGEQGRRKINQYTRYGTVVVSVVQGVMLANWLKGINQNGQSVVSADWASAWNGYAFVAMTIITLTTGTAFIMWLGERIQEKGIGNGTSMIIFAGIVAGLPSAVYQTVLGVREGTYQPMEMVVLVGVIVAVIGAIVFMERGQRRIPVQYAKRIVGNKQYGGQATHLPLKVNTSGVIPPIFASSLLMFPATLASFVEAEWMQPVQQALQPGTWQYMTLYVLMMIFFAFFYTSMVFNPVDVADNLKKFGGFVPGVRPGRETAEYIDSVLTRITFAGALYLAAVCILPTLIQMTVSNQVPFYFGGTGLLIVVGVALDTAQQIEGHLITRHYDGFAGPSGPRIRGRARTAQAPTPEPSAA